MIFPLGVDDSHFVAEYQHAIVEIIKIFPSTQRQMMALGVDDGHFVAEYQKPIPEIINFFPSTLCQMMTLGVDEEGHCGRVPTHYRRNPLKFSKYSQSKIDAGG